MQTLKYLFCSVLLLSFLSACNNDDEQDDAPIQEQETVKDSIFTYSLQEVTVPAEYDLNAALTLPDVEGEKVPALIIVPGSGPVDKDGLSALDPGTSPPIFLNWSEFFAGRGIAVLRYDKRVLSNPDLNSLELDQEDQIQDVRDCIEFMAGQPEVDASKIYVLGHSEGGNLIAPASEMDDRVSGLFIVNSVGFSVDTLLLQQLELNAGLEEEQLDQFREAFKQIREGQFPAGTNLLGAGEAYWKEWIYYSENAIDILRSSRKKVRVIQGLADENFPGDMLSQNLSAWERAAKNPMIELKKVEGASHSLLNGKKESMLTPLHWYVSLMREQ